MVGTPPALHAPFVPLKSQHRPLLVHCAQLAPAWSRHCIGSLYAHGAGECSLHVVVGSQRSPVCAGGLRQLAKVCLCDQRTVAAHRRAPSSATMLLSSELVAAILFAFVLVKTGAYFSLPHKVCPLWLCDARVVAGTECALSSHAHTPSRPLPPTSCTAAARHCVLDIPDCR